MLTRTSDTAGKHSENPIILLSTPTTFSALLASIQILSGPLFPTVSSQKTERASTRSSSKPTINLHVTTENHTLPVPPNIPHYPRAGWGGEEIKDSKAHEVTKNETEVIQVQCAKSKHNKGAKAISSSPPAPWGQPHHFHPEPGISVLISRARVLPVLRGSSGTAMSSQWSVLPLPSGRSSAPSLGQWDLSIG